ncbi:MAG: hypothetical protein NTX88_11740 [Candidatus Atribacteria bacterium]|nr:hypothetical protein [Candidatus Atribacteria bacterium]
MTHRSGPWLFLLFLSLILLSGCARGDQPSWGEIGKTMTVRVYFQGLVTSGHTYYYVFDTDGNILTGPQNDPKTWDTYYVARYENGAFYLKKPDGTQSFLTTGEVNGSTLSLSFDLDDLNNPKTIEIQVVSADILGNVLDSLANYFSIDPALQRFITKTDTTGDSGEAGADIIKVEVEISF